MRSEDGTFGYIEAGLPNITGSIHDNEDGSGESGALYGSGTGSYSGHTQNPGRHDLNFDASRSNPIYGNSDTVQPPSIKVRVKTRYR